MTVYATAVVQMLARLSCAAVRCVRSATHSVERHLDAPRAALRRRALGLGVLHLHLCRRGRPDVANLEDFLGMLYIHSCTVICKYILYDSSARLSARGIYGARSKRNQLVRV